jgi:hydrogenase maturation protease
VRERWPITGEIHFSTERLDGGLVRLRVQVENVTAVENAAATRDEALRSSLTGAHLLLGVDGGEFVSLLDPPEESRAAAANCRNLRTWPVLIDRGLVLSSPIILPDHPEVAKESPGDLYDATEIDEILTLRTRALTDQEKREARSTDARAAAIVDRVDHLPAEMLEKLHGAVRSLEPAAPATWWDPGADASVSPETDSVEIGGVSVAKGSVVRLHPGRHADAQDMFLEGRLAEVQGVYLDVEDRRYLAVTLEDDPAADLHQWHGRFFYFSPDEVEPAAAKSPQTTTLVAGVGNVFFGDDGFGVEVARRLQSEELPAGVRVADYGIRGVHLAYQLLDGYDTLILIDAIARGEAPGTVSLIEPRAGGAADASMDAHGMDPAAVLALVRQLGGRIDRVLVVGCEPAEICERMGLSEPVARAVDEAARLVRRLVVEPVVQHSRTQGEA